jgi:hypothetical protein
MKQHADTLVRCASMGQYTHTHTHTTCCASLRTSGRGHAQLCEGKWPHMHAEVQASVLHKSIGFNPVRCYARDTSFNTLTLEL